MNDMSSPFGLGREKAENYPEHAPRALIRGLPATSGAANGPELECEFRKIYTDRTSVLFCRAMAGKLTLLFGICPDTSAETQGRSWAGHDQKMGNSRTERSKMGKERTYERSTYINHSLAAVVIPVLNTLDLIFPPCKRIHRIGNDFYVNINCR
jgi:hypothetical protein